MHHLIYMSRAVKEMEPTDLVALLLQAREANEQAGITGALVYGNRQFMQVIEGEQPAVEALYARIVRDSRHRAIFKLADKPIQHPLFRTWSMAFRELAPDEFDDLASYLSPALFERLTLEAPTADQVLLTRMRELLQLQEASK